MLTWFYNRKGTSLVEVLTTLAVLVVGILSVARVFSGGFNVLKRGENVTIASRLAEREFERLRSRSDTLPLGITLIDGIAATTPGPPITDANRAGIRQIIGETVKIPAPSMDAGLSGAVVGSVHNLTFAPIAPITPDTPVRVYSAPMQRRVMDSTDSDNEPWNWLRMTQYAIDYDEAKICFRSTNYMRTFVVSYSYWTATDTGREIHVVSGEHIEVPAGAGWLDIPLGGASVSSVSDFEGLDNRSDQVSRAFNQIAVAANFDPYDPYQYKIFDVLLGRIAFNPAGYSFKEQTPQGVTELTAHIDYYVYDWGILNETFQVPDSEPFRIHTTLKNIKQMGVTVEDDGSLYPGMAPGVTDVLVVDEATGANLIDVAVDYRNGIIELAPNLKIGPLGEISPAGRTIRVFYRAEGNWQVQVQKAYERYTENDTLGIYREYGHSDTVNPTEIRFNPIDAGKSFSVDYLWVDSAGDEHTVVGEVHRAPDGLTPGGRAYINLNHIPVLIREVRGVSLKVRVMWSEGSKLDSSGNAVPRWQNYDLDGELSRTLSLA